MAVPLARGALHGAGGAQAARGGLLGALLTALARLPARLSAWSLPPGLTGEALWRAQTGIGLAMACVSFIAALGAFNLALSPALGLVVIAMALISLGIFPLMRWSGSAAAGAHYLALVTLVGIPLSAQLKGGLLASSLHWMVAPLIGCTLALGTRKALPWLAVYSALPIYFALSQAPTGWPAALGPPWTYAAMRLGALALTFWLVSLLERERWRAHQALDARQAEAARQNQELRLLLDNVEQAFLTVDARGRLLPPWPAPLARWWASAPPERLAALLARGDAREAARLEERWAGALPSPSALPGALELQGRALALEYKPLPRGEGERGALLVILTDMTAVRLQQRAERQQGDLVALLGLELEALAMAWAEASALYARATARREALDQEALLELQALAERLGARGLAEACQESLSGGHSRHLTRAWRGLEERIEPGLRRRAEVALSLTPAQHAALLALLREGAPAAQIEAALRPLA